MAKQKGSHLTLENREVIEEGLRAGDSASRIGRRIGVCASTVTREVKANRTAVDKRGTRGAASASKCARYGDCRAVGTACPECAEDLTACRRCRARSCAASCPDFERRQCPDTEGWPFVCDPECGRRGACAYPRYDYRAADADASHRRRLSSAREGIDMTEDGLAALDDLVSPLVRQGQSFEAVCAAHGDELPVCARTLYNYQERGVLSTADLELPRKVRMRPRRKKGEDDRSRVDRSGRSYDDFAALDLADRARVVQLDSVCGRGRDAHDILSMQVVACSFQIYLYKARADASAVVAWLDVAERALGSPGAFEAAFPVLLADRGVEFDDWEGMERSCLDGGGRRCRVFYCDPMAPGQKAQAERNHEQLRRILPKGRSRFDDLSVRDVATCCSHVNSYALPSRAGRCGFELAEGVLPRELLDELGLGRVPSDEVVLKPYLMAHAVEQ